MNHIKIVVRPALLTMGILLIPFFGNMYVDGWNWPWTAFAFFGVVLFGAGLAYELVGRNAKAGVIGGFGFGVMVGILVIAVLRYFNPEEDTAGIVIITLLLSGLVFAFVGYLFQNYLKRK
ncbi:MAG: hypothetical protein EPO31_07200 [Gammaproteobacteria bacterium]|nr:MAG: hypothetical protein EPO31_07200 [Gammaproteobacteria bacterium]